MQRQAFGKNILEGERTQQSLARLEALAQLMDGAFLIPGTNIRVGLDAVIGLVPVAGDLIASLVSSYLIWEARQLGAPKWLIARISLPRCARWTIMLVLRRQKSAALAQLARLK
jgi:Domain of unknown function (DUF4112)